MNAFYCNHSDDDFRFVVRTPIWYWHRVEDLIALAVCGTRWNTDAHPP
jgi:hypothetical protein